MLIKIQTKSLKIAAAKIKTSVKSLKASLLMTVRSTFLIVNDIKKQMLFLNKNKDVYIVNKHKIALNRDDNKKLV